MVAVFLPGLKSTRSSNGPDHQSQAALPGLIHDVSAMAEGGLRFSTMWDSMSRPGSAAIMRTHEGVASGVSPETARPGSSMSGDRLDSRTLALDAEWVRYMPA